MQKKFRSLTAAGVLTGATVLGGVGLAGASDDADTDAEEPATLVDSAEVTSVDEELTTGEPEAPALPEAAAERARTATAGDLEGSDAEGEGEESDEGTTPENHGQHVSTIARDSGEEGRAHGEAVSEAARSHGEAQREQAPEDDDAVSDPSEAETTEGDELETGDDTTADPADPDAGDDGDDGDDDDDDDDDASAQGQARAAEARGDG